MAWNIVVNSHPKCGTRYGHTCTVIGIQTVPGIKNARDAGQFGCRVKRPGPPDLPREINDCFGATVYIAVGSGYAHFPEQIFGRQGEKGLHARVLQSREAEAARFEGAAEEAGERRTGSTITVEKKHHTTRTPS